ncbi:peptidyl-prolyl cis-trans isomerase chloroplastic [Raphidocelis subcapitata]|uniref:peptidylprolyl isomerase n=1 Tax=Raphidocelis subcapitata TaxID=307507 RepID=A0A2V0NWW5_9CHLO|nr:peptidyl-prolyl cis-trans isomerase chloroplastic [Raphidocelis subcapitata]|eukprot:GBF91829.1 peptidyl-prolyl cis-trans isomerase chloroplastic [Raphidocelis subcapitata]
MRVAWADTAKAGLRPRPGAASAPAPPRRRPAAAAAAAERFAATAAAAALAAAAAFGPFAAPAVAKPNVLDVPACSKLQPASAEGVKFCEVKAGSGESPLRGDLVTVDYTARAVAAGGQVFEGSSKFKFFVGENSPETTQVMSGFDLAILGDGGAMGPIKEGGVRTVLLPPRLAYGERGDQCLFGRDKSCRVPPNSEVELTFRYNGLGY